MWGVTQWPHVGLKLPQQCYQSALSRQLRRFGWKTQHCPAVRGGGWGLDTQGLLPALCWLLQHFWYSLCSTAQGTCCFPPSSIYLGLIMFGGGCFVQCINVFTHCLVFWLHLHSCSSSSALLHLRPLSRPEPLSDLCLPWFCFTPWVCVHESWRRRELVKDESREMQFNVRVPKLTKTSVRWQEFTLQGSSLAILSMDSNEN